MLLDVIYASLGGCLCSNAHSLMLTMQLVHALQLNSKDRRNEFEIMFATLTEWKDTYRTTLVPKQVAVSLRGCRLLFEQMQQPCSACCQAFTTQCHHAQLIILLGCLSVLSCDLVQAILQPVQ